MNELDINLGTLPNEDLTRNQKELTQIVNYIGLDCATEMHPDYPTLFSVKLASPAHAIDAIMSPIWGVEIHVVPHKASSVVERSQQRRSCTCVRETAPQG